MTSIFAAAVPKKSRGPNDHGFKMSFASFLLDFKTFLTKQHLEFHPTIDCPDDLLQQYKCRLSFFQFISSSSS
jgi:hypothetical protein